MSMRVHVETLLPCSPHAAWQEVQRCALLEEVSRPVVTYAAACDSFIPKTWHHGATVRLRCWLFGWIPLATRTLLFERVDDHARQIQTREHDRLIRQWDHLISIRDGSDGTTFYSDTIDVDAGWLTLPVWFFAQCFYRHRQRRWRRGARRL